METNGWSICEVKRDEFGKVLGEVKQGRARRRKRCLCMYLWRGREKETCMNSKVGRGRDGINVTWRERE